MPSLVAAVLTPFVPAGSTILVGLSGGVDSVVLLHLLQQLAPSHSWKLSALHVHHGISPRADAWAAFCTALCARLGVPLKVEHVDITPLREMGIEAAARELRHAALDRQPADFIALAHHIDDQVETMLLQLLRGAGLKGAAAMPVIRDNALPSFRRKPESSLINPLDSGFRRNDNPGVERVRAQSPILLRPLLEVTRAQLVEYAQQHSLQWVEDESNADDAYPRNFLRHRVLPLLEQRFPAYRQTLARSARHFAEAAALLDELAAHDAHILPSPPGRGAGGEGAHCKNKPPLLMQHESSMNPFALSLSKCEGIHGLRQAQAERRCYSIRAGSLEVPRLQKLSHPRAKNLLRHFLAEQGAPIPDSTVLDEMLRQLCEARRDAAVRLAFGGWQVRRFQGRVYTFPDLIPLPADFCVQWRGEAVLQLPELGGALHFEPCTGQGLSREKLQQAVVSVRLRHGAERIRPDSKRPTRTLKNLLQEQGMPPWQRDSLPLLYCGGELVCAPGVATASAWQAQAGEAGLLVSWHRRR